MPSLGQWEGEFHMAGKTVSFRKTALGPCLHPATPQHCDPRQVTAPLCEMGIVVGPVPEG